MSDEISVILELTQHEAIALRSLLLRGVGWHESGRFGAAIRNIYYSLFDLVPPTPNYTPAQSPQFMYPTWKKF